MKKMAIIGAGHIAKLMAQTVNGMEDVEIHAITSSRLEAAKVYAQQNNIAKVYESADEMLNDKEIDLVYIATPHVFHYEYAKKCLNANKHVLCEKPFCINAEQTREIIELAQSKNLLITEAIWTRYMPSRKIIDDVLKSGKIGEVTSMTANIGYNLSDVPRIWDPKLGGGALLDVGVYLIHLARMIFGEEEAKIETSAVFKNDVDMIDYINMTFQGDKVATMQAGVNAVYNRNATILGTKGYIEITNTNNPELIKVFDVNYQVVEEIKVPEQITGYEYEVEAALRAIDENKSECSEIPHKETIIIMEIIDSIFKLWEK